MAGHLAHLQAQPGRQLFHGVSLLSIREQQEQGFSLTSGEPGGEGQLHKLCTDLNSSIQYQRQASSSRVTGTGQLAAQQVSGRD